MSQKGVELILLLTAMQLHKEMHDYTWLLKSTIGMLGTGVSIALENVSTTVSIIAGLLTCVYMVFQIMKAHHENKERSE